MTIMRPVPATMGVASCPVPGERCGCSELPGFERRPHRNHGPERTNEDRGQPIDRKRGETLASAIAATSAANVTGLARRAVTCDPGVTAPVTPPVTSPFSTIVLPCRRTCPSACQALRRRLAQFHPHCGPSAAPPVVTRPSDRDHSQFIASASANGQTGTSSVIGEPPAEASSLSSSSVYPLRRRKYVAPWRPS